MNSRRLIKIRNVFKQNAIAFFIVFFWFVGNYLYFSFLTSDFLEGVMIIFYFKPHNSLYGNFYASFTEFIIFGLLISLITIELFRKYNPVETSRELAKNYSNHAIIIGYSHIGKRLAQYFREQDIKHVIVEEDYKLVEDLVSNEEPVINDTPLSIETLEDAGIRDAEAVYITSDEFDTQIVVSAHVREYNNFCKLYCRVFEDDIAEVIAKTYNAQIISTSKYAANVIYEKIRKNNYRDILIIGINHLTLRLLKKIKSMRLNYHIIEKDDLIIKDADLNDPRIICADASEVEILEQINIKQIDCVINVHPDVKSTILITKRIRDLNRSCKIIARFFLENVAEILEISPFRAEVISSSKHTLEIMEESGMLEF